MTYNASELQRLTGEPLRSNLKQAFGTFCQEEQLQKSIQKSQRKLDKLQKEKEQWKLHSSFSARWVTILSVILILVSFYFYFKILQGNRRSWATHNFLVLTSVMFFMTLLQLFLERKKIIAYVNGTAEKSAEMEERLKKLIKAVLICVIGEIVCEKLAPWGKQALRSWWFFFIWWLISFAGTLRFLGWLDCHVLHVKEYEQKADEYFADREDKLKENILKANTELKNWNKSDAMAFARAAVPNEFQNAGNLAVLLYLMENTKIKYVERRHCCVRTTTFFIRTAKKIERSVLETSLSK